MPANARRRPLVTDGASEIDRAAKLINPINNRNNSGLQIVRAEIINSGQCTAQNITAHGPAPILKLCRLLIKAGFNPGRSLHAYRGDVLCITARTIGEAARIDLNGHGTGFIKRLEQGGTAPPMRQPEIWGAQ